jgi:hypothetical protein
MNLDPADVFRHLTVREPVRLSELPKESGIYALHDHTGAIRYIGITISDRLGFYGRIHNRHAAGSEIRSHKFSHAYNTGRMWRAREDDRPDAIAAKALRSKFIRRNCKASFLIVPQVHFEHLGELEVAVQALAPTGMLDWGGKRGFDSLDEPAELVDALLDELGYGEDQRSAIARQAALHRRGTLSRS